jgi:16S rRNA processing protein RimM
MAAAERWAWLARIRRTQGRKGEVFAEILTDFPEKFSERTHLWLLSAAGLDPVTAERSKSIRNPAAHPTADDQIPRAVQLVAHWRHKGGVVLHFAGVDSIDAAENLIGLVVAIPWSQRGRLEQDAIYIGDLIGCTLVNVAGPRPVVVGRVQDVDRTAGPAPLLIVEGARGQVLVPFAKSFLPRFDLEGKRVEMALPEGLIELNDEPLAGHQNE